MVDQILGKTLFPTRVKTRHFTLSKHGCLFGRFGLSDCGGQPHHGLPSTCSTVCQRLERGKQLTQVWPVMKPMHSLKRTSWGHPFLVWDLEWPKSLGPSFGGLWPSWATLWPVQRRVLSANPNFKSTSTTSSDPTPTCLLFGRGLIASACVTPIYVFLTNPLSRLEVIIQTGSIQGKPVSLISAMKEVAHDSKVFGLRGLFRGQGIGMAKAIVSLTMFHEGRIFLTSQFKDKD